MIKIIALILTFFLTGCASFLQQSTLTTQKPVNHYLPWAQRKTQLNALKNWQANGNIAIQVKKSARSNASPGTNASFSWQQMQANYELRLFGPFGSRGILLSGNPQQVTLFTRDKVFTADNAERLLSQQLGLHLPILPLYYWLRGLPAPQLRYTINLDAYNRLLKLRQSGWQIEYLHYSNVGKLDVPDQMILINPPWKIRLLITHWDID